MNSYIISEQLKIEREIYPLVNGYITNENYSCRNSEILRQLLLNDNKYILIEASTGTGKTSSLLAIAKQMGIEYVAISPLVALAEQTAQNIEIPGISKEAAHHFGITLSQYIEEYSAQCAAVFDKLRLIIDNSDIENKVLIIDEAHHLVTSSGFRSEALRFIEESIPKFKKVIFLTGTPETLYLHSIIKNARIIKFGDQSNKAAAKYHYQIIPYGRSGLQKLFSHISNRITDNKSIVFINNINQLILIKKHLINSGVAEESIFIAHSNAKQNKYFKYLVENELIHSDIKYFLTTSVISDGINIKNDDIDNFYLFDTVDLTLLRQIIKRPRKQVNNIFDFVKGYGNESWYDVNGNYRFKYDTITSVKSFIELNAENNPYLLNYFKVDGKLPGIYFDEKNMPTLYESEIIRMIFDEYYNVVFNDEVKRKELILDLEKWDESTVIIDYASLHLCDTKKLQKTINEEVENNLKVCAEKLLDPTEMQTIKQFLSYGDQFMRELLGVREVDSICKEAYEFYEPKFNALAVKIIKERIKFLRNYNLSNMAFKSVLSLKEKDFQLFKDRINYGELVYTILEAKSFIQDLGFDNKFNFLRLEILFINEKLAETNYEIYNLDVFNSELQIYCYRNSFHSVFGTRNNLKKILSLARKQKIVEGEKLNYYKASFVSDPKHIFEKIGHIKQDIAVLKQRFELYLNEYLSQAFTREEILGERTGRTSNLAPINETLSSRYELS